MNATVERCRRHVLPPEELKSAIDALLVLLRSAQIGARVTLIQVGAADCAPVELSPTVHEAILDAISLLAARGRLALVAVDDTRHVKSKEAADILDYNEPTLFKLLREMGFPKRLDPYGQSYSVSALLEAFHKRRDEDQTVLVQAKK